MPKSSCANDRRDDTHAVKSRLPPISFCKCFDTCTCYRISDCPTILLSLLSSIVKGDSTIGNSRYLRIFLRLLRRTLRLCHLHFQDVSRIAASLAIVFGH